MDPLVTANYSSPAPTPGSSYATSSAASSSSTSLVPTSSTTKIKRNAHAKRLSISVLLPPDANEDIFAIHDGKDKEVRRMTSLGLPSPAISEREFAKDIRGRRSHPSSLWSTSFGPMSPSVGRLNPLEDLPPPSTPFVLAEETENSKRTTSKAKNDNFQLERENKSLKKQVLRMKKELENVRSELDAVKDLAIKWGAGKGEIERTRVRARVHQMEEESEVEDEDPEEEEKSLIEGEEGDETVVLKEPPETTDGDDKESDKASLDIDLKEAMSDDTTFATMLDAKRIATPTPLSIPAPSSSSRDQQPPSESSTSPTQFQPGSPTKNAALSTVAQLFVGSGKPKPVRPKPVKSVAPPSKDSNAPKGGWAKTVLGWETWKRKEKVRKPAAHVFPVDSVSKTASSNNNNSSNDNGDEVDGGRRRAASQASSFLSSAPETDEQDHEEEDDARSLAISTTPSEQPVSIVSRDKDQSSFAEALQSASPPSPDCGCSNDMTTSVATMTDKSVQSLGSKKSKTQMGASKAVTALLVKSMVETLSGPAEVTPTHVHGTSVAPPISAIQAAVTSPLLTQAFRPTPMFTSEVKETPHPPHFKAVVLATRNWIEEEGGAGGEGDKTVKLYSKTPSVKIRAMSRELLERLAGGEGMFSGRKSANLKESRTITVVPVKASGSNNEETVRKASAVQFASSKDAGYLSAATGALGRALGLAPISNVRDNALSTGQPTSPSPNLTLPNLGLTIPTVGIVGSSPAGLKTQLANAPFNPASNLPSNVELEPIVAASSKPPTLSFSTEQLKQQIANDPEDTLLDRYGFSYSIQELRTLLKHQRQVKQTGEVDRDEDESVQDESVSMVSEITKFGSNENDLRELCQAFGVPDAEQQSPSIEKANVAPVKLLLMDFVDRQEAMDKSKIGPWESFIRKRQSNHTSSDPKQNRPKTQVATANAPLASDVTDETDFVWSENLIGVGHIGRDKSGKEDWNTLRALVQNGIPNFYRAKIWMECSGATEHKEPGLMADLLATHRKEHENPTKQARDVLKQIEMDCRRTFPKNAFFGGDGPGVAKLWKVLVAYSWHNPEIGYCQSMNQLAATLLLIFPMEEDAFWVFSCLIEYILPSDYYTGSLLVSRADQRVLHDLLRRVLPDVHAHFEKFRIHEAQFTFGWFLTLFTDLPFQTVLRIWDVLMVEGAVILFRVALAILSMESEQILAFNNFGDLLEYMHRLPKLIYNAERLMTIACEDLKPLVKGADINALREKYVKEIIREDSGQIPKNFP